MTGFLVLRFKYKARTKDSGQRKMKKKLYIQCKFWEHNGTINARGLGKYACELGVSKFDSLL